MRTWLSAAAFEAAMNSGVGLPLAFGGGCMPTQASRSAALSPLLAISAASASITGSAAASSFASSFCFFATFFCAACFARSAASARFAATSFFSVSGSSSFHVLDSPSRVASSSRTPISVRASSRT